MMFFFWCIFAGFLGEWALNVNGVVKAAIFSAFGHSVFRIFRDNDTISIPAFTNPQNRWLWMTLNGQGITEYIADALFLCIAELVIDYYWLLLVLLLLLL